MNILIIGLYSLKDALLSLGHNALHADFISSADIVLEYPITWAGMREKLESRNFAADLVFYADNGNLPFLLNPQDIPVASIYYSIDTYCNPWHVPYAHAFDQTFVAQKDFLPLFLDDGQNAQWFPLFCSWRFCERETPGRDVDVSFVGTIGHKNNPQREPFLREFNRIQPLQISSGDFVPVFSRSRIVLNQTAFGELNFRCFEAMGLGAALLMEKCGNGLEELFQAGTHILLPYSRNNALEAAKIAGIYLGRPQALAEVAQKGRDLIKNWHTDLVRAAQLLETAKNLLSSSNVQARLATREKYSVYASTAFAMLASEMSNGDLKDYRDFYYRVARGH